MEVTRKELLASGAALALVAGCGGSKKPAAAAPATGWAGVRSQFALDYRDRHFDAFLFAPHPKPVRAAIEKHRKGSGKGRDGSTTGRYVPVEERRAVWERDGESCAYVSPAGRRCGSTHQLELHHVAPFAKGGPTTADNLIVVCKRHNAFHAARDFP